MYESVISFCMSGLSHSEFQERYGDEVIPYNFDEGPYDGIHCPECESVSPEDEWDWVDTIAYETDDGVDIQGVRVVCPECGEATTYR